MIEALSTEVVAGLTLADGAIVAGSFAVSKVLSVWYTRRSKNREAKAVNAELIEARKTVPTVIQLGRELANLIPEYKEQLSVAATRIMTSINNIRTDRRKSEAAIFDLNIDPEVANTEGRQSLESAKNHISSEKESLDEIRGQSEKYKNIIQMFYIAGRIDENGSVVDGSGMSPEFRVSIERNLDVVQNIIGDGLIERAEKTIHEHEKRANALRTTAHELEGQQDIGSRDGARSERPDLASGVSLGMPPVSVLHVVQEGHSGLYPASEWPSQEVAKKQRPEGRK